MHGLQHQAAKWARKSTNDASVYCLPRGTEHLQNQNATLDPREPCFFPVGGRRSTEVGAANEHVFVITSLAPPGVVIQLDGHGAERLAMTFSGFIAAITQAAALAAGSRNDKGLKQSDVGIRFSASCDAT